MELMDGMGAFRLGSHLSCLFLTLGIRDLGYELDHAWEHTEADQKDPVDFVAPGAYQAERTNQSSLRTPQCLSPRDSSSRESASP
ncbi:Phenylalanine aminomutase (L-beta-phenylalanine forming) [Fusarium oxysporum f. sp. albedinis]|nr:Phenylalanine aminomutase (L-beta-phenylalanine forming) [Fusarium oxysporum f. sp. albedinis]